MNWHIKAMRERISKAKRVEELSEADMWAVPGPLVWQAKRFRGRPSFYPVYRCGDSYSYSPLALILSKGSLSFDAQLARQCNAHGFRYLSGRGVLDREIERIGGPQETTNQINSTDVYVERIVAALRRDIAAIEVALSGFS
jgi:hypothetical protein